MYRQENTENLIFSLYEIINKDNELLIRNGTCGKKIKENKKTFENSKDASKAYNRNIKTKRISGFFECEGDDDFPNLDFPFGITSVSENFSERLSLLENLGIYLSPAHHRVEEHGSLRPISEELVKFSDADDKFIINRIITNSEVIKRKLNEFKKIELEISTIEQWEDEMNKEAQCTHSLWEKVNHKDIELGLIKKCKGIDSVDIYLDILNGLSNQDVLNSLVRIVAQNSKENDMSLSIEELTMDAEDFMLNDVTYSLINNSSKVRSQLINWLFTDCTVAVYEVTTSPTYCMLGKFQALKIYLIRNRSNNTVSIYIYDMFFEC